MPRTNMQWGFLIGGSRHSRDQLAEACLTLSSLVKPPDTAVVVRGADQVGRKRKYGLVLLPRGNPRTGL